jgi:superfamily II DNA or RNA helicase
MTRDELQMEALQSWINSGCVGNIILPTGTGKSKLALMAAGSVIEHFYSLNMLTESSQVLIVTSRINLKINEFPNTIKKFGYEAWAKYIKIHCLQSAYKFSGNHYLCIIVDEVHNMYGTNYTALINNNSYYYYLGLTATLSKEKEIHSLSHNIPIVYKKTFNDVVRHKIVNPVTVINVAITLNETELNAYQEINLDIENLVDALVPNGTAFDALKLATKYSKDTTNEFMQKLSLRYFKLIKERLRILQWAESRYSCLLSILSKHQDEKIIVFTGSIGQLETYYVNVTNLKTFKTFRYHSQMTKKERLQELDKFAKEPKSAIIFSAEALNEGVDIPDCSVAIVLFGTTSQLVDTQRKGRIARFADNKNAIMYNVYVSSSIEHKYVLNRTKENKEYSSWITMDQLQKST